MRSYFNRRSIAALALASFIGSAAADPLTTQPNAVGALLSPCAANVPLAGNGVGVAVKCATYGTGVTTFFTTPSSANLASVLTDETGMGALVFGTSPNITTPTGIVKGDVGLGNVDNTSDATKWAAVATVVNKVFNCAGNTCTVRLGSDVTGTLLAANAPAYSGDVSSSAGSLMLAIGATKVTSAMLNADVFSTARSWSGVQSFAGTATNDNAAVGNVGEIRQCTALNASATVTITIAQPNVVTWTAHGQSTDGLTPIVFSTNGALPNDLAVGTTYWTVPGTITANTFQIASSIANAIAGTALGTTTGSQSGTHTATSLLLLVGSPATHLNFCALSLHAGDWEVTGTIGLSVVAATNVTYLAASIGTTIAALDQTPGHALILSYGAGGTVPGTAVNQQFVLPTQRVSVAATTTLYGDVISAFTGGVAVVFGSLRARIAR
jgi:hypothetical protein